jgi:hypothetical protein
VIDQFDPSTTRAAPPCNRRSLHLLSADLARKLTTHNIRSLFRAALAEITSEGFIPFLPNRRSRRPSLFYVNRGQSSAILLGFFEFFIFNASPDE